MREDAVPSDMLAQMEEKRQELVGKSRVSQGRLTLAICMTVVVIFVLFHTLHVSVGSLIGYNNKKMCNL